MNCISWVTGHCAVDARRMVVRELLHFYLLSADECLRTSGDQVDISSPMHDESLRAPSDVEVSFVQAISTRPWRGRCKSFSEQDIRGKKSAARFVAKRTAEPSDCAHKDVSLQNDLASIGFR